MDVGCSLRGFEASTMTLQHDSHSVIPPISQKILNHLQRHISVRVHPHVHPQHIRVLKHIVYIIWMWDAVYRGLEGPPTDKTTKENPPKCILASKMPASRGILA